MGSEGECAMTKAPVVVRAPLRISFAGGGTDLPTYYVPYGGLVVSAAITRYCYVVASPSSHGGMRITSSDYFLRETFKAGEAPAVQEPLALPKAAIEWFTARGWLGDGVDLLLASDVPPGTGLGSSSAMAVALVLALATYVDHSLSPGEIAEIASWLEIERLDMPIGKQDQFASAFGDLNAITFTTRGVEVRPLRLPEPVSSALASRLLLFSTGHSRHSGTILRQQKANIGVKPEVTNALHRLKVIAEQTRNVLAQDDLDAFGRLLDQSWQIKRGLSQSVSSTDIDTWYAAAREAGAEGGKITGAGGGGFLLLYCPSDTQESVRQTLGDAGLPEMTFDFDHHGARVLTVGEKEEPWPSAASKIVSETVLFGKRLQRAQLRPGKDGTNHV